jgi:thiamine-phosphate pyrophosphorylase
MANRCLLYYITDRKQFANDENTCRRMLLEKIAEAARLGVDYIQLREKDLSARALRQLAQEAVRAIQQAKTDTPLQKTRLLINSRTDVALAAGAGGVHLRSDDISVQEVKKIVALAGRQTAVVDRFLIAVSCHSKHEVRLAESEGADFAVFAPVFEKKDVPGTEPTGCAALQEACTAKIPVFALGGVTIANAALCLAAGAAGIAGIRLFQENKIEEVVRVLQSI